MLVAEPTQIDPLNGGQGRGYCKIRLDTSESGRSNNLIMMIIRIRPFLFILQKKFSEIKLLERSSHTIKKVIAFLQ